MTYQEKLGYLQCLKDLVKFNQDTNEKYGSFPNNLDIANWVGERTEAINNMPDSLFDILSDALNPNKQ